MSKRTINEIYRDRLEAEANEADNLKLTKLAENITRQIESNPVRAANASYTYSASDFNQDIQDALWKVVIRTADFHGVYVSSETGQAIVDFFSDKIVSNIRKEAGISSDIGAYEDKLPGEQDPALIEVELDV